MTDTVPGAPANHVIERSQLELLYACRPDPDVVRSLWHSQRSRRLLLLNAVIDAGAGAMGPLPQIEHAVAALEAAEAADPVAFQRILLHPTVGSWAAYALRRLHRFVDADRPLWIDVGLVHALALAAAHECGLDWHTELPLHNGRVMLPRLGMARFPEAAPFDRAEAHVSARGLCISYCGREVLAGSDEDGWLPLRWTSAGDVLTLTIAIDDIDPFRELAEPIDADRLSPEEFTDWSTLLDSSWTTLCRHHRPTAEAMSLGLVSMAPTPPADLSWGAKSASTGEAFGALLTSYPSGHLDLAVTLVHEFAHIQLGGLLHLMDLTREPDPAVMYAPWRDDPRPLGGLLQGIYAFTAIASFWRDQASAEPTDLTWFEYARARGQVAQALAVAGGSPLLTTPGNELIAALRRRTGVWVADTVPDGPFRVADLVLRAHQAGWRIRNLRPDDTVVDVLAGAWISGRGGTSIDASTSVVPNGDDSWSLPRAAAIRLSLPAPDFGVPAVDPGDVALANGELANAVHLFRRRIDADPNDLNAWTGLGLAGEATALVEHPDLVYAVYRAVVRAGSVPDPVQLAVWVGDAITTRDAGPPG